jgi:hypothetical protein
MIVIPNTNANFSYIYTPAAGQYVAAATQPAAGPFVNLVNFPYAPVAAFAPQPGRGISFRRVPDANAVYTFVPGFNPTGAGAFYGSSQNLPAGQFVPGLNQTLNGNVINGVGNAPLIAQAPTPVAKILWAPIGAVPTPTAVTFKPTAQASLLSSTGTVVSGTNPPYVDDLTVLRPGQNINGGV